MDRFEVLKDLVITNKVYDVASDHAILAIMLSEEHEVIASDISLSSIKKMMDNVKKANKNIKVIQSDGLTNLDIDTNSTIVIAGVGTYTVLKMLRKDVLKLPEYLVIQANNNHDILRREVCKLGYYIDKEETIYINRWYTIIRFKKGYVKYNKLDYLLGPNPSNKYILFNLKLYKDAYKKIPRRYFIKKIKLKFLIKKIEDYIK